VGTHTPIVMLLADRYDRSRRGAATGWLIASTSVGYAASLALAALAIAVGGYRMAFIVTGMMPAVGAALLLWALRNTENASTRGRSTGAYGRCSRPIGPPVSY
jgi:MFS family permease